ncbi:MAG: segregation/condensation protein A [Bdellovibrionales bacterium]|nr:segregation/condensation protein A [Oligoflexia bacterium]
MSLTTSASGVRPFTIRLEQFEGPLDLMLYLIQSQELDISNVSITKITDQYLNTLKLMQEMDFDIASEFLVMAATLILWKSRALMPKEEVDEALLEETAMPLTQEELVRQLLMRQRYLEMAGLIAQMPLLGDDVFTRPNKRPPVEKIWKEMSVSTLATTYQDLLIREQRRARIVMKKETVSLAEKISEFGRKLTVNQLTRLDTLISDVNTRGEWVVGFLASLELSRLKKIKIYQEKPFDPIFIELLEIMIDFDARQASGFSYVRTGEEVKS